MGNRTLWVVAEQADPTISTLVLYWLAYEAGLSWKGRALVRRRKYRETLPKRTRIARIASGLGLSRQSVYEAIRHLTATQVVRRASGGRLEPDKAYLFARFMRATPATKFKIPLDVAARRDLNLTDKLVLGKLHKCATQDGHRWAPKAWQLALDCGRHVETVRRSLRKLGDLALVSKTVVSRWAGYVLSLTTHVHASETGPERGPFVPPEMVAALVARALKPPTPYIHDEIAYRRNSAARGRWAERREERRLFLREHYGR